MIKEEEIEYYRQNITDRYVISVMTSLELEERQSKIQYKKRINKLKYHSDYKQCKRCGEVKPLTEFYKNILKSKGVFDYCKECAKKRQRELRNEKFINRSRKIG
jgi:hypothetical protein